MILFNLISLAVGILTIAGMWKAFEKAGKPGWASIVPIYNVIILFQIAGRPPIHVLLLLIPIYNIILIFQVNITVAKKFGKDTGFGVGLTLLGFIFWPMLGFGDATYTGDGGMNSGSNVLDANI